MSEDETKPRHGGRRPNQPRPKELAANAHGMAAARLAHANNISLDDAARLAGSSPSLAKKASVVLRFATTEEIAAIDAGMRSVVSVAEAIRDRSPRATRERKQVVTNEATRVERKLDRAIWEQLTSALDTLTALPRPADVIHSVRRHHQRVNEVERKLANAYAWIEEFSDAWTKRP